MKKVASGTIHTVERGIRGQSTWNGRAIVDSQPIAWCIICFLPLPAGTTVRNHTDGTEKLVSWLVTGSYLSQVIAAIPLAAHSKPNTSLVHLDSTGPRLHWLPWLTGKKLRRLPLEIPRANILEGGPSYLHSWFSRCY